MAFFDRKNLINQKYFTARDYNLLFTVKGWKSCFAKGGLLLFYIILKDKFFYFSNSFFSHLKLQHQGDTKNKTFAANSSVLGEAHAFSATNRIINRPLY